MQIGESAAAHPPASAQGSGAGDGDRDSPTRRLELRFIDGSEHPLTGETFTLRHAGGVEQGTLDGDGRLRVELPVDTESCTILVGQEGAGYQVSVRLVPDPPGQTNQTAQGMLQNLGFYSGAIDGTWSARLKEAVEEFQCFAGLPASGQLNAATWARLRAKATAG